MAPRYISLAYLIYFRMITFYLLPMLAECGRGSISLQSPVTYQVETDQCKRSFESVMPDCYFSIPFNILLIAIQTSSQKHNSSHSPTILLIVWSANSDAMVVLFTSKASSNSLNNCGTPFQVNLQNDDTYRWNCAASSYGQIE